MGQSAAGPETRSKLISRAVENGLSTATAQKRFSTASDCSINAAP
jgi:hypothetical protein